MSERMAPPQHGYTLIEMLIVVAIAAIGLTAAVTLFGSADSMIHQSHAHLRAAARHRANLAALAGVLRSAEGSTLEGFGGGVATTPAFDTIVGYENGARLRGGTTKLEWRPASTPVDDVDYPGHVHLVDSFGDRVIAEDVPLNGFLVRQEGRTLVVQLTTYYATSTRKVAHMTSETSVSMRN